MKRYIDKEAVLYDRLSEFRRVCKCGHSYRVFPRMKGEYFLCNWCGSRIYKDIKEQKKYDRKCQTDEFRFRFAKFMESKNI